MSEIMTTPEKWYKVETDSFNCDMLYIILREYQQRSDEIYEKEINGMYPTNSQEAEYNDFTMDFDIQKLNDELDKWMVEALKSEEYINHMAEVTAQLRYDVSRRTKRNYYLTSTKDKEYRINYKKKTFDCKVCGKSSVNLNHRSRHNRSFKHKFRKGILECNTLAEFLEFMK